MTQADQKGCIKSWKTDENKESFKKHFTNQKVLNCLQAEQYKNCKLLKSHLFTIV